MNPSYFQHTDETKQFDQVRGLRGPTCNCLFTSGVQS